jgi:hypothetical protein
MINKKLCHGLVIKRQMLSSIHKPSINADCFYWRSSCLVNSSSLDEMKQHTDKDSANLESYKTCIIQ